MTEEIKILYSKKNQLEFRLKALSAELNSFGLTLDTPLIDDQGFPRNGIDLYKVKSIRGQIRIMQNDLKSLNLCIMDALPLALASNLPIRYKPFLRIHSVDSSLPGFRAGLLPGDLVVSFGSLTVETFAGMSSVSAAFANRLDHHAFPLKVQRGDSNFLDITVCLSSVEQSIGCVFLPHR